MDGFSPAAEIISQPPLTWRISLFIILAVVDIGFNAAAGAAAAATGAHVNSQSDSKTAHDVVNLSRAVGLGALAGLLKSGILALVNFGKQFGGMNLGMWLILALVASSFGICVVVTSAVSSLALGEVPGGLLIAAIVTAIPLAGEMAGVQLAPDSHIFAFTLLGWDSLAGYVFARMAHNEGTLQPQIPLEY
ncbi:uncharacterized protein BP5553_00971 [Venustampulla echinocandica]|uniref:Uncharacterized protein n=1 Tax=Venustampulla echinocandica TaxID=2656787 RepID=A0A370TZN0_9HELO|nr:uncharacterized protein BP5553_00971 [Venustampulla echinocandica]RDL40992.1 hypothetical protein BP5553_00971 [Venustampulla echinocandica]